MLSLLLLLQPPQLQSGLVRYPARARLISCAFRARSCKVRALAHAAALVGVAKLQTHEVAAVDLRSFPLAALVVRHHALQRGGVRTLSQGRLRRRRVEAAVELLPFVDRLLEAQLAVFRPEVGDSQLVNAATVFEVTSLTTY